MKPNFKRTIHGFTITDPIERHTYPLTTNGSVSPNYITQDRIPYPIDSAAEIETAGIMLPVASSVLVRDVNGSMVAEVQPNQRTALPKSEYLIDISVQIKVYLRVDSSVEIYTSAGKTHIELDDSTRITVGARSYHRRPAHTITTTSSVTDVMQAVSVFGSALKTTKAERSFPNSRGHPPALEIGDELNIPRAIGQPETGVTLEVPPTLSHVFSVTPLAYYLGADVISGSTPKLVTKSGYSFSLDRSDTFSSSVERTLKRIFFLDCIVRSEGATSLPLYEQQNVESDLDFDPELVYDQPLHTQLETYLSVPFSVIEPNFPEWRLRANLRPVPEQIPFLPFLADSLTIIKPADEADSDEFTDQLREPVIEQSWATKTGSTVKSTTPLQSYTTGISQSPKDGAIEVTVICNEPSMSEELVRIYGTYGERDDIPIEITIDHELTKEELAETLSEDTDFVHYIGHIDSGGFRCLDGRLDATAIDSVKAKLFFLNACHSYHQGVELIESGSIGGIVTSNDVQNSNAIRAGSTIARLLDYGYSLYAAVDILREATEAGKYYRVVGNGLTTVAQPSTGVPDVCFITTNNGELSINIRNYLFTNKGIGTISIPYIESIDTYHLIPKDIGPISVTKPELVEFLELEPIPALLDGEFRWSDEIKTSEL